MNKQRQLLLMSFFMLMIVSVLSACSASVADIKKDASKLLDDSMDKSVKESDEITDNGTLYTPLFMSVEDVSENNIILKQGSQTYILFNNIQEDDGSKVLYESIVSKESSILLEHSIERDGAFAYLVVQEESDELVLVTVGIGGKKMTTETEIQEVADETEKMMEIIRSFIPEATENPSI